MGIGFRELLVIIIVLLFWVMPFWRIFKRAGFSPGWSLLMWVPLVNFLLLLYLAFAAWPALPKSRG